MSASNPKSQIVAHSWTVVIVACFFTLWEMFTRYGIFDKFYTSQPSSIFIDLKKLFVTGDIFTHISITMQEAMLGLLIGASLGILTGFILGQFQSLARALDPIVMALYGIPKLALGPLFILWFGLGIESKVFLAALTVFFLVFFNSYAGFRNVDTTLISAIKLMGATNGQILRKVVLPSCLPWILAGLRGGIGSSLLGAIVGEYMGSTAGIGWMVQYAGGMYDTTRIFSCIIILMVIMASLNGGLKLVEMHLLKWRPQIQE